MTENKRFIRIVDHLEKEVQIYDTINEKKIFNIFFNELDSAICLNGALTDTVDLLNYLSDENEQLKHDATVLIQANQDYRRENEQLKQFQEQVARVIESKMGDNVCNDYKIEVLKEIWNELKLDEVWFE